MAIASAFISSNDRLQSTPCMLPQRMPAAVAAIAASPHATAIARSTRMPTDQDAPWSSETARMMMPARELNSTIAAMISAAETPPPIR